MTEHASRDADPNDVWLPPRVGRGDLRACLLAALPAVTFLLTLAVRYALTNRACGSGMARMLLETSALAGLFATSAPGLVVWRETRSLAGSTDADGPEGSHRLLQRLTMLVSAFFTLLTVAMWIPSLMLSPCDG